MYLGELWNNQEKLWETKQNKMTYIGLLDILDPHPHPLPPRAPPYPSHSTGKFSTSSYYLNWIKKSKIKILVLKVYLWTSFYYILGSKGQLQRGKGTPPNTSGVSLRPSYTVPRPTIRWWIIMDYIYQWIYLMY